MYDIIRFYKSAGIHKRIIEVGVTLEEARAHCKNPETSSRTCAKPVGRSRTRRLGDWFDGYREQ